jgi:hypothetical protein
MVLQHTFGIPLRIPLPKVYNSLVDCVNVYQIQIQNQIKIQNQIQTWLRIIAAAERSVHARKIVNLQSLEHANAVSFVD